MAVRPSDDRLRRVLVKHYGNMHKAGRELRATRQTIWNWVRALGIMEFVQAQQRLKPIPPPRARPAPHPPLFGLDELRALIVQHQGRVADLARTAGTARKRAWFWIRRYDLLDYVRAERARARNSFRI